MQKHSFYLCKYFAANQIHVDLVHYNQSTYDPQKLEFFSEKERAFIHPTIIEMPSGSNLPGHYVRDSYQHSKKIFEFLEPRLKNYDFIYTKGFTGWHLIDQKYSGKIECCKIGVNFHGYEMFQPMPDIRSTLRSFLLKGPAKKISRKADIVFSYGGKITNIVQYLDVPNEKIIEIPSGIEEEFIARAIKPTGEKKHFVYMGRYERRKGVEELNEALKQLVKTTTDFEFHFIGPIPNEKKIEHAAIIYHGEIRERKILLEKLSECDVLVCPSHSEGFPNVILEAMSRGLAVAATKVGAVELMVDKEVGWIMSDPSPKNILSVLQTIIAEEKLSVDEKKQKAISRIRSKFTWDHLIKELISKIF
jgi:glycosyltransferase involved in cell wall biosynthesis